MMYLPYKCTDCNHEFRTIDEQLVFCPNCNKSNVEVHWEKHKINRLLELDEKVKRYEKALQIIIKDSELFNTTTKKTTYSYPGKIAKKALEGQYVLRQKDVAE